MRILLAAFAAILLLDLRVGAQCDAEPSANAFGLGTRGALGVPDLRNAGAPIPGAAYHVELRRAAPGAVGIAVASLVETDVALPAFGGSLYVAGPAASAPFAVGDDGVASPLLGTQIDPALCGLVAVAQAAVIDPLAQGGAALSNGLRIGFGVPSGHLLPAEDLRPNRRPRDIEAGDLDGDGDLDLVVVTLWYDTLDVLAGRGDGTFEPAGQIPLAFEPVDAELGDFDGDGVQDVVVTGFQAGTVVPFLVEPGLHLVEQLPFEWTGAGEIAVGDVNVDGALDLAVTSLTLDQVIVAWGDGAGAFFAVGPPFPLGASPEDVLVDDVDLDGSPDLVVASYDLTVLLGDGGGGFTSTTVPTGPGFTSDVDVGDWNGDALPDLAVCKYNLVGEVRVLPGAVGGGFGPAIATGVGARPLDAEPIDLDGDAHLDLVVVHDDETAWAMRGAGNGTFHSAHVVSLGNEPRAAIAGDLDGDGFEDFAAACYSGDRVSVRIGLGDGTFVQSATLPKGSGGGDVLCADLDGDLELDLVAANVTEHSLSLYRSTGAGLAFAPHEVLPVPGTPRALAAGDVDLDGDVDVAFWSNGWIRIAENAGAAFLAPVAIAPQSATASLFVEDVNGDGTPDLVSLAQDPPALAVVAGLPGGGFASAYYVGVPGPEPDAAALGDLDGDGDLDAVVVVGAAHHGSVLLYDGTAFQHAPALATGLDPRAVALSDLDHDGDLDVVVANLQPGTVSVCRANGDGTFADPAPAFADALPHALAIADVDGDSVPDVVAALVRDVAVLPGAGDGTLEPLRLFCGRGKVRGLAAGDLDRDGVADVAHANVAATLRILRSQVLAPASR